MKFSKIFFLAAALILASINITFAQAETTTQVTETISMVSPKVKGITCGKDLKTISANIKKLNGVTECKTGRKGRTTTFHISYDAAVVTLDEIYTAIENTSGCKNPNDRPYKVKNKEKDN